MRRTAPLVAAGVLLLAGCASTVTLTPAPQSTSAGCAGVVVRLPAQIDGLERRTTDAQGTAAWGPDPAVTLVCGVGRSPSANCGTIDDVDWTAADAKVDGRPVTVRTTYGRDPAVQIVKPATVDVSTSDLLSAVSDAVRQGTRATGDRCTAPSTTPDP